MIYVTPEGTSDRIFEDCAAQEAVAQSLRTLLKRRSFREVMTPTLEYYDTFAEGVGRFPQESMFYLCDRGGRILVLRPDNTAPIARLCATRLKGQKTPLRLFYHQAVYQKTQALSGREAEQRQMGIELIGAGCYQADLEILSHAASCLLAQGGNFRLEIGHVGFFDALCGALSMPEPEKERIRMLVEQKSFAAVSDALLPYSKQPAAAVLSRLPRLFGGEDVLREAKSLFASDETEQVLSYLRRLYQDLSSMGYREAIAIDLGLVHKPAYYTGVLFRGYVEGVGEAVLLGGRYDTLLKKFGNDLPAIGFGINIDMLAERLLGSGIAPAEKSVLIHPNSTDFAGAQRYMQTLLDQGIACEMSFCKGEKEAAALAAEKGLASLHVVGDAIRIIEMGGEK